MAERKKDISVGGWVSTSEQSEEQAALSECISSAKKNSGKSGNSQAGDITGVGSDDSDDDDFYDRTSSRAKVPSLLRFTANKSDNACSQAMHAC